MNHIWRHIEERSERQPRLKLEYVRPTDLSRPYRSSLVYGIVSKTELIHSGRMDRKKTVSLNEITVALERHVESARWLAFVSDEPSDIASTI